MTEEEKRAGREGGIEGNRGGNKSEGR